MKTDILKITSAVLAMSAMLSCQHKEWTYDNKLFITGNRAIYTTTNIKVTSVEKTLVASMAKPAEKQITIKYAVDESLVPVYNKAYYDNAVILPESNWSFSGYETAISEGTIESAPVTISFKDLDLLSKGQAYVLPVTIQEADMEILSSARTTYFVFRDGAIINVAADFQKDNYISFEAFEKDQSSVQAYKSIEDFTLEALVNIREFSPGIQSIMGMEGKLLMRVSDNGLQPNQFQIVTPFGNYPTQGADASVCALTPGKWTHIAVTGNSETRDVIIYLDGEIAGQLKMSGWSTIDIVTPYVSDKGEQFFHIGYSYEPGREMDGMISECRIWNVVRTQDEIKDNFYDVDPKTPGLLGYWKFNEGSGDIINVIPNYVRDCHSVLILGFPTTKA